MQTKTWIEIKSTELNEILKHNYSAIYKFDKVFVDKKLRVHIMTEKIYNMIKYIQPNDIGLYFGRIKRNKKILLSVEGAQIIGKKAKKNIVILNKEQALKYIKGEDVKPMKTISCEKNNFVIVKYKNYILGSGIFRGEYIENTLPKSRRIISTAFL